MEPGPAPTRCKAPCCGAQAAAALAIATVTAPSPGAPWKIALAVINSAPGPAAARAAASATLAVPTSFATTADGFGTLIGESASAEKKRNGHLRSAANASRAGSSAFRSRLATPAMAASAKFASLKTWATAFCNSNRLLFRSQPIPSQSTAGCQRQPGPSFALISNSALLLLSAICIGTPLALRLSRAKGLPESWEISTT